MTSTHECSGGRSFDGELSNQRIIVKLFRSISAAASSLHICCCLYKLYTHKLCQTSPHHRPSCCHNRSSHSHFNNNVAESNLICRYLVFPEIEWMVVYGKYSVNEIFTIFRAAIAKCFFYTSDSTKTLCYTSDYTKHLTDCNWLIHWWGSLQTKPPISV